MSTRPWSCKAPKAFQSTARVSSRSRQFTRIFAQLKDKQARDWKCTIAPILAAAILSSTPTVQAADLATVGTCLLRNCQSALAQCLGDANCLKNIVCLNSCTGKPDETSCQIRCGDLYEDQSVDIFNSCAVSDKKCVPERVTEGLYPVPPDCAIDRKFKPSDYQGRWFITAGQNELFDIFDCQVHYFTSPDPNRLLAKINWRIPKPNGDFIERSTMQSFVQEAGNEGVLLNHGNEYLHYEDDWYIIKSKPESYFFVYYKGNNDAWKGYGGAVVYTRASSLPTELIPELKEAAESVGLDWGQFKLTNNTCPPHPVVKTLKEELQDDVKLLEKNIEDDVKGVESKFESSLRSFGRGFTVVENDVIREITEEEKLLSVELMQAEATFKELEADFAREFGLNPSTESAIDKALPWVGLVGLAALLPAGELLNKKKHAEKADSAPPTKAEKKVAEKAKASAAKRR